MTDEDESKRKDEMASLRGELIPKTFLLLHSVLHNTGQYQAISGIFSVMKNLIDKYDFFHLYSDRLKFNLKP